MQVCLVTIIHFDKTHVAKWPNDLADPERQDETPRDRIKVEA